MKRIVDFLGSIQLAIILLIVLTFISVFGIVIPQGLAPDVYIHKWGSIFGNVLLLAGLDRLFSTWWFYGLLILLSLNIFVCSFSRMYKKLKLLRSPHFIASHDLKVLPTAQTFIIKGSIDNAKRTILRTLKSHLFRCSQKADNDTVQIYAGKGTLKEIGTMVFHLSLILLLIGGLIGKMRGYSYEENINKGASASIPGKDFRVRCDWFTIITNDNGEVADYKSKLTIIGSDGAEVVSKVIEVNNPLSYDGIKFYQSSYGLGQKGAEDVQLLVTGPGIDPSGVDIRAEIGQQYAIAGTNFSVSASKFLSDFIIDMQSREAFSRSTQPNNPAVKVELTTATGDTLYNNWVFLKHPDFHTPDGEYRVSLKEFTPSYFTGIKIRKDPGVPFIWAGIILMSISLYVIFTISRKKLWVLLSPEGGSLQVTVASTGGTELDSDFTNTVKKLRNKLAKNQ